MKILGSVIDNREISDEEGQSLLRVISEYAYALDVLDPYDHQTFEGKDLYPSIEEKGANLLYFITKNHSFTDGNN